jgi:hypothetical protein
MLDLIIGLHLLTYHNETAYTIPGEPTRIECVPPPTDWHLGYTECNAVQPVHRLSGNNPGLYAIHRATGLGGGVVRNSFGRWSAHASWTWAPHPNVDVSVGVITREGVLDRTILLVSPSVHFQALEKARARLALLPGKAGNTALHLGLERSFTLAR